MSLRKVEARFSPSDATGDMRFVEVFGVTLTAEFTAIEVSDAVLAKLRGNPHIVVKDPLDHDGDGRKGGSKKRAAQDAPPDDPAEATTPPDDQAA
jgi:hypothetical protein